MVDLVLQTERDALRVRLLGVLVVAAGIYLGRPGGSGWLWPVVLSSGYLAYVMFLASGILPRMPFPWGVYGMIVVDMLAVALGLLIVGRLGTPLFALFPVLVLYYSIHLGYASSIAAATVSSLAYTGVGFIIGDARELGGVVAAQVPLLYLLALLGGFVSSKRMEERREKESLQEAIGLEGGARKLLEITRQLSDTLESDLVLARILESAIAMTGMRGGWVALVEGNGRFVSKGFRADNEEALLTLKRNAVMPVVKGSTGQLAMEKLEEQWITDLATGGDAEPSFIRGLPYRSLLVIPLVNDDKALGVLYLFGDDVVRQRVDEVRSLGALGGTALLNARRYQESLLKVAQLKGEFEELVEKVARKREARGKKTIQVNGLHIDLVKGEVTVDGKQVNLSPIEFELLTVLAENAGEPLRHSTLLRLVWGADREGDRSTVDVSIHRLRRKIENEPSRPDRIVTVRGVGYVLSTEASTTTGTTLG